jgi:hypothetical protein
MQAALLYGCAIEECTIGYVTPQFVLDGLHEDMSRAQGALEQHRRRTEGD